MYRGDTQFWLRPPLCRLVGAYSPFAPRSPPTRGHHFSILTKIRKTLYQNFRWNGPHYIRTSGGIQRFSDRCSSNVSGWVLVWGGFASLSPSFASRFAPALRKQPRWARSEVEMGSFSIGGIWRTPTWGKLIAVRNLYITLI